MTYLIDDFSVSTTMHQLTYPVGSVVAVADGGVFPFSVISGDSGLSVTTGVITLTQGEYYAIAQLAETNGQETLMKMCINGTALDDKFSQPARIASTSSATSSNVTSMSVFRAQDGDLLTIQNFSGDTRSFYVGLTDLVLLRRGNR